MNPGDFSELKRRMQAIARDKAWDEHALAGCAGKQGFDSFEHAMQALKRMRERHSPTACAGAHSYRCQTCGKWHLGTRKI